jgi:anti-sigma B factor antagonist
VNIEESQVVDDVRIVRLAGKMDTVGARTAQDALVPNISAGQKLIIDMTDCEYVASSGLRVLLIAAKQAAQVGCRAVLCGVQPLVWDVIVMTGFEDVLERFPTQADAIAGLK